MHPLHARSYAHRGLLKTTIDVYGWAFFVRVLVRVVLVRSRYDQVSSMEHLCH